MNSSDLKKIAELLRQESRSFSGDHVAGMASEQVLCKIATALYKFAEWKDKEDAKAVRL